MRSPVTQPEKHESGLFLKFHFALCTSDLKAMKEILNHPQFLSELKAQSLEQQAKFLKASLEKIERRADPFRASARELFNTVMETPEAKPDCQTLTSEASPQPAAHDTNPFQANEPTLPNTTMGTIEPGCACQIFTNSSEDEIFDGKSFPANLQKQVHPFPHFDDSFLEEASPIHQLFSMSSFSEAIFRSKAFGKNQNGNNDNHGNNPDEQGSQRINLRA